MDRILPNFATFAILDKGNFSADIEQSDNISRRNAEKWEIKKIFKNIVDGLPISV